MEELRKPLEPDYATAVAKLQAKIKSLQAAQQRDVDKVNVMWDSEKSMDRTLHNTLRTENMRKLDCIYDEKLRNIQSKLDAVHFRCKLEMDDSVKDAENAAFVAATEPLAILDKMDELLQNVSEDVDDDDLRDDMDMVFACIGGLRKKLKTS